eukprot:6945270-Pyramimonas_sp.AAC.1
MKSFNRPPLGLSFVLRVPINENRTSSGPLPYTNIVHSMCSAGVGGGLEEHPQLVSLEQIQECLGFMQAAGLMLNDERSGRT